MLRKIMLGTAMLSAMAAMPAGAQSPNGYGSIVTIPVVVQTATYQSAIFIHNPQGVALTVKPDYVGADGSSTVGPVSCGAQVIPANTTFSLPLTSLCPLNAGSNFGRLKLFEQNTVNLPFAAYSRVETFSGNGFSIEGFPIGNFSNSKGTSYVNGLRRQASSPGYQTNCFIGSLNEAVTVIWGLENAIGATLAPAQNVTLGANQMVRILDVFTSAGAPAGDWSNVRAYFGENGVGEPSFVAFCTVQNNVSFDADFRIAKSFTIASNPEDQRQQYSATMTFSSGVTTDEGGNLLPNPSSLGSMHNWMMFVQHPDWLACTTNSQVPAASVEIRLLDPAGTVVAGGAAASFPETYLGEKSTRNNGVNGLWKLQVSDAGSGPVTAYSVTCTAGNGLSRPIYGGATPDAF